MRTIVLASQKGGSGKSTLAIGLAFAAMEDAHTARLVETDPQGTISSWQRRRTLAHPDAALVVHPVNTSWEMEQQLRTFASGGVTLAIIDTAGGLSAVTTAAIRSADLCLIPARPSLADIEAMAPTLRIARSLKKPFAFILNQTPTRSPRIQEAAAALGDAVAADVPDMLALPSIVMRNDHQDALGAGLSVTEYVPEGKSAEEIRSLWKWVGKRLAAIGSAQAHPASNDVHRAPALPAVGYLPAWAHTSAMARE